MRGTILVTLPDVVDVETTSVYEKKKSKTNETLIIILASVIGNSQRSSNPNILDKVV